MRVIIAGRMSDWEKRCVYFEQRGIEIIGFINEDLFVDQKRVSHVILGLAAGYIEILNGKDRVQLQYDHLCLRIEDQESFHKRFIEQKWIITSQPIIFRDLFGFGSIQNITFDSNSEPNFRFLHLLNNRIQLHQCDLNNVNFSFQGVNNSIIVSKNVNLHNCYFHVTGSNNQVFIDMSGSVINSYFYFNHECQGCQTIIGKSTSINGASFEQADDGTKILIGDDCLFSNEITFMTSDTHSIVDDNTGVRVNYGQDIVLESHVWVCKRVTVLKGVTVGSDSVLALGSVVTKSVPKNCIVGGNPAKIIKKNIRWDPQLMK